MVENKEYIYPESEITNTTNKTGFISMVENKEDIYPESNLLIQKDNLESIPTEHIFAIFLILIIIIITALKPKTNSKN